MDALIATAPLAAGRIANRGNFGPIQAAVGTRACSAAK
jgi:hypothetical protein